MDQHKLNKFAMQAGGIWRGGHVEQPNGDSVWTEQKWVDPCDMDLNKFAELIVRECADVIAPMGDWCGGHGEPSMPSTMECAKRLKQHFGVEE